MRLLCEGVGVDIGVGCDSCGVELLVDVGVGVGVESKRFDLISTYVLRGGEDVR